MTATIPPSETNVARKVAQLLDRARELDSAGGYTEAADEIDIIAQDHPDCRPEFAVLASLLRANAARANATRANATRRRRGWRTSLFDGLWG